MVERPSVSGRERALAEFVSERMTEYGLDSHVDEVGNVIGVTGAGGGPVLLLLGHIDTVPGDIPVRVEGRVLHGRGSVDAKGPLATMICAAARVGPTLPATVVVIGAVDEERTSIGARHLLDRLRPDAVVIGEPSGVGAAVIGYKGVLRLRVTITAPAAHTSSPETPATQRATDCWATIESIIATDYPEELPLFDRALPTLVSITGDLEHADLDVSVRVPLDFDAPTFLLALSARIGPECAVTVVESVPAVRTSRNDPVARALHKAMRRNGLPAAAKVKLGTSDMNLAVPHWKVPAAAYGPGDSRLCHTVDEHIDLDEFHQAIAVLADALRELAITVKGG